VCVPKFEAHELVLMLCTTRSHAVFPVSRQMCLKSSIMVTTLSDGCGSTVPLKSCVIWAYHLYSGRIASTQSRFTRFTLQKSIMLLLSWNWINVKVFLALDRAGCTMCH
jgi:hypothetical protein